MNIVASKSYFFEPKGVCCKEIRFRLEAREENGLTYICVFDIDFLGGCPGNLSFISKLFNGSNVLYVLYKTKNHKCGNRNTSCMDQLNKCLEQAVRDLEEVYCVDVEEE